MNKVWIPFVCLWLSILSVQAEPVVKLPEGNLACSIKVSVHQLILPKPEVEGKEIDPALLPPVPTSATVERLNDFLYIGIKWLNGSSTQAWFPGKFNVTLFQDLKTKKLNSTRLLSFFPSVFYLDKNKTWYQWADSECLQEEESSYSGVPCRRYQKSVIVPGWDTTMPPSNAVFQLWVAKETLLPVAFDSGDERYELTFSAPTSAYKSVPEEVSKEILRYERLLSPPKRLPPTP